MAANRVFRSKIGFILIKASVTIERFLLRNVRLADICELLFKILSVANINLFNTMHPQPVNAEHAKVEQNCAEN